MPNYQAIQNVNDFESLVRYLEDELEWPFRGVEDVADALYEFDPEDFGLDLKHSAKVHAIKQIVPFVTNQPWGIFWIDFGVQKPSITSLRGILRGLVKKKSESANESDRQRFALENLLFILTSENFNKFDFAYFRNTESGRSSLSVFGWEKGETHLRTLCEHNLPKLQFPASPTDEDSWLLQWREAFDVEKVTKRFFDEYKEVFHKTEEFLETSILGSGKEELEQRRTVAQRLFNRLMFIYFLQKKGWLSFEGNKNYLQALFDDAETNGEEFFRRKLYFLFFHGLSFAGHSSERKTKDELRKIVGEVPFLNGGLFEIEDVFDVKDRLKLPNELFSEILRFFSHYNFTVEESTPSDVQVAVDPEMLGKIFEQIVTERESERSERKSKGRYYTPRYIVSFMYREAIKHFLAETGISKQKIKDLVDRHHAENITVPEAENLLDKLDSLRVVDPACGSGAYLLGCLHEIFTIRQKLDTRSREATSKDDHHRKLRVIRQNIYGVDLDNFAVQIARLRLWLSLIVDFEGDKPEPLPNLDFKIEQGDSLTSPNPSDAQGSLSGELIQDFASAKSEFFLSVDESGNPISVDEKEARRKIAEKKRHELRSEIASWRRIRGFSPSQGFDWQVEFGEVFLDGGFQIVLANPPYGAETSDKTLRERFFGQGTTQSKESYGLFIARGLELLRQNGTLCYIVSDTWRTIKSHKPLRSKLLDETTVKHFVDLPTWIFDATVNTSILTLTKTRAEENHNVIAGDLHNLPARDWDTLYKNLEAVAEHSFDAQTLTYARYTYPQRLISTFNNLSFFVASPELYRFMSDTRFTKLGQIAAVKQGLATADNQYYLRKRQGVRGSYDILDNRKLLTDQEIANLTDDEKRHGVDPNTYNGRHFLPYDKGGESDASGGWLPNYYVPTGYFIDWSRAAVHRLRTATIADIKRRKGKVEEITDRDEERIASRFQNSQFYFREGLTYSPTGFYAPTFRLLSPTPFDKEGSGIFFGNLDVNYPLGVLCSLLSRYFSKQFINHTVHAMQKDVEEIPINADDNAVSDAIRELVSSLINKQTSDRLYPYHSFEQKEIDELVYKLYGLTPEQIREVELWYCRRYDKLAKAQGVTEEVERKYKDHLSRCERILSKPPEYWQSSPILTLIAKDEGSGLELKETLEANNHTGEKHPGVLLGVLKTIAAFLNTAGGTLLIGVSDTREIKGLDMDLQLCKKPDLDSFELKLQDLIKDRLKSPVGKTHISFESFPEGDVCRVDVDAAPGVTFVDGKDVYVRVGNRTEKLEAARLIEWSQGRVKT